MEGSNLFSILAYLPAEASFGFVDHMRRKSSGAASASLMLSHWERLQVSCLCKGLTATYVYQSSHCPRVISMQ